MPRHSFEVGDGVELVAGPLAVAGVAGHYVVVRLMPNDAADREYRVRSSRDGHERVVRESQMRGAQPVP